MVMILTLKLLVISQGADRKARAMRLNAMGIDLGSIQQTLDCRLGAHCASFVHVKMVTSQRDMET